jgi:hypothetical protein
MTSVSQEQKHLPFFYVNVFLGLNTVTAQVRLANNVIKGSPGFSIFVPGDLHTINLEDFSAVRYTEHFLSTVVVS